MGAITAAEAGLSSILILEATNKPLEKVRLSGGGRCNVTNACWTPQDLVNYYPRGMVALRSPFSRFATGDAVSWFNEHNLNLIEEGDGRIFPKSNNSSEVVACLRNSAKAAGVSLKKQTVVTEIQYLQEKGFLVNYCGGTCLSKFVLLATGGHPSGRRLATKLGHNIVNPVPSLFSFSLKEPLLSKCAGLTLNNVQLKLQTTKKNFFETGRVLLTHKGISGPAVLRLSAFGARDLNSDKYTANLTVNWLGENLEEVKNSLQLFRCNSANKTLISARPFLHLPKRLWATILKKNNLEFCIRWAELSKNLESKLIDGLINSRYLIVGKGPFGEEFVTAGGVDLSQVNMKTMESRLCKGLFFAGELLDIDGVTGGFNFQHCWTSGWLAGNAIAKSFI